MIDVKALAQQADPFGEHGRLYHMAITTPKTLEAFAAMILESAAVKCDELWQEDGTALQCRHRYPRNEAERGCMTDKELLEMAARAAGVSYDKEASGPHLKSGAFWGLWLVIEGEPYEGQRRYWNPLTDDGDSLRLATKLLLDVSPSVCRVGNTWYSEDARINGLLPATRRAIVRAAAEIGKAMP